MLEARFNIRWAGTFVLAGLLLGGISAPSPGQDGDQQMPPLKIKVGEKAPDFALTSSDGKTVRLSDYAGHHVLIDFYRGYW